MATNQPSHGEQDFNQIPIGSDVIGADNEKVGEVAQVLSGYLVISKGWIFTSERYIPQSAIREIASDSVFLDVTKDEIDQRGWDTAPETTGATYQASEDAAPSSESEEQLELREEQLRARRETAQTGEVDVGKDVVSEQQSMQVPREHEEVDIEYHRAEPGRPASGPVGEDEEVRMPVHEEEVHAEKETEVTGEVDVHKRTEEETEEITGEVRREEPRVERKGDADVHAREGDEEQRP